MALDVHPQLLRALRAVLDTGSFTAAAERLRFTQSALSKQIRALEAAAGTTLFRRGARGVEVTVAGQRLARRAAAVLDQLDAAERELADLEAPVEGRVALGGFATAAMHLVPRAVARVREAHPGIEVSVHEASTPVQIRRLRAGRLDLAILGLGSGLADYDLTGIESEPLPVGPLHIAVSTRHRLAHAVSVQVDELGDEAWVAGTGARGEPQFGPWPSLPAPRVVAELGEWSTRLGFVAAGLGITTIPALVRPSLPPDVVAVRVDDPAWRGRWMALAWIGAPPVQVGHVRDALVHVAADIAAAGRGEEIRGGGDARHPPAVLGSGTRRAR